MQKSSLYDTRFDIIDAVRNAYIFVWREIKYLSLMAIIPLALQIITLYYTDIYDETLNGLSITLWSLPASITTGWFFFIQTRLILLGERTHKPAITIKTPNARGLLMQASILVWILFGMGMALITTVMQMAVAAGAQGAEGAEGISPISGGIVILSIGCFFWALRFSVAHIVVTMGLPLRTFIFSVNGAGFSLRLIALGALCILPIMFLAMPLLGAAAEQAQITGEVPPTLFVFGAIVGMIAKTLLNAAAVFALRDIFWRKRK